MGSNNDIEKKFLFDNITEYQNEVDRLKEIVNQQHRLIEQLSESKARLRKDVIIPITLCARSYPKTFPRYQSPLYDYVRENTPIIMELSDDCFNNRMASHTTRAETSLKWIPDKIKRIEELLLLQSKGKFLTKQEKERCTKYAETTRKNRSKKK